MPIVIDAQRSFVKGELVEIYFRFWVMKPDDLFEKSDHYCNVSCGFCKRTVSYNYMRILLRLKRAGLLDMNYKPICCFCAMVERVNDWRD